MHTVKKRDLGAGGSQDCHRIVIEAQSPLNGSFAFRLPRGGDDALDEVLVPLERILHPVFKILGGQA
jgi:hypothetical protein